MADRYPKLRAKVIDVLNSAPCQKISFYYAGRRFDGVGFTRVARAVEIGKLRGHGINVDVDTRLRQRKAEAMYSRETDTLIFPDPEYGADDDRIFPTSAIVHECAHALLDGLAVPPTPNARYQLDDIPAIDDEVAAFVAGWLYASYEIDAREARRLKADGVSVTVTVDVPPTRRGAHAWARTVAAKIKDKPGSEIPDDADLASLKVAILASPTYRGLRAMYEHDQRDTYGYPGIKDF